MTKRMSPYNLQSIPQLVITLCFSFAAIPQLALAQTHLNREADSVVDFHHTLFPSRDARRHSPYFQPDASGTNPEYLVHGADTLSVKCVRKDTGATVPLTLSAEPPLDNPQCIEGELVRTSPELRIPCSLLIEREAEGLKISACECTATLILYDSAPERKKWLIDYKEIAWRTLQKTLEESVVLPFDKMNCTITISLLYRERVYPIPGDRFVLRRVSRSPKVLSDEEVRPYATTEFALTVDVTGSVHVPTTTLPSVLDEPESPLERKVVASIERATHIVPIYKINAQSVPICTLDDLASCLTAAPAPEDKLPECLAEKCRLLGINHLFRPKKTNETLENLRYFAEPSGRTWSLVLPNGRVVTTNYGNSCLMSDAITNAYHDATGEGIWDKAASVHVLLRTQRGRSARSEPLISKGVLSRNDTSVFDSALILPGDRIWLTRPDTPHP